MLVQERLFFPFFIQISIIKGDACTSKRFKRKVGAPNQFVLGSSDLHPDAGPVGIRTNLYHFLVANSHR